MLSENYYYVSTIADCVGRLLAQGARTPTGLRHARSFGLRPFLAAYRDGDAMIGVIASDCTVWQTAGTDSRRSAGDSDNYRNEVELKRGTR